MNLEAECYVFWYFQKFPVRWIPILVYSKTPVRKAELPKNINRNEHLLSEGQLELPVQDNLEFLLPSLGQDWSL